MDKDTLTKKVLEVFSDILPDIDAGKLDMTAELTTEYGVNSVPSFSSSSDLSRLLTLNLMILSLHLASTMT